MMALTRSPRSFSVFSIWRRRPFGSRFKVSGSTSEKMGVRPTCSITCTAEQNVSGVVMTESPAPIPRAKSDRCNAAVPELTASASGAWTNRTKSSSKRFTFGPVVIQSERRVSMTSLISSSPINGGENGSGLSRRMEWPPQNREISNQAWLRFLQKAKIVSTQRSKLGNKIIEGWPNAADCPAQRRCQGDPAMRHRKTWEESPNLRQSNAANIWICGIIKGKVVPQQPPARNEDATNFSGGALLHFRIQHGREQHELRHKIEAAIVKRQFRSAAANNLQAWGCRAGLFNKWRKQVDPP